MKNLTDVSDELCVAKNFIACVFLACESSLHPGDDRAALCAVSNAAREKLEAIIEAIDVMRAVPREAGR